MLVTWVQIIKEYVHNFYNKISIDISSIKNLKLMHIFMKMKKKKKR